MADVKEEMKEIKDYLHLYLGCEMTDEDNDFKLMEVTEYGFVTSQNEFYQYGSRVLPKPILRSLSDITLEEKREWTSYIKENKTDTAQQRSAEEVKWLLSKHFDLFGLTEAGLAIDKTEKDE